jgi:hypothetical protein
MLIILATTAMSKQHSATPTTRVASIPVFLFREGGTGTIWSSSTSCDMPRIRIPPLEDVRPPVPPGTLAWHDNLAPQKALYPVNVAYTQGSFFGCLNRTARPLDDESMDEKRIGGTLTLYRCTDTRRLKVTNTVILEAINTLAPVFFSHPDGPSLAAVLARAKEGLGTSDPLEDWYADAPTARSALDIAQLLVMDHACLLSLIIALSRWESNNPVGESWLDLIWNHKNPTVREHANDIRSSWISNPVKRVGVLIDAPSCEWGHYAGAFVMAVTPMWIAWGTSPSTILVTQRSIPPPLRPRREELVDVFPHNQPGYVDNEELRRQLLLPRWASSSRDHTSRYERDRTWRDELDNAVGASERRGVANASKSRVSHMDDVSRCPRPRQGDALSVYWRRRFAQSNVEMASMSASDQQRITDRIKDVIRWKVIPRKVQVYKWTWLGTGRFTRELQTHEDGQAAWEEAREDRPWQIRVDKCYGVCEIAEFFSRPDYGSTPATRVYKRGNAMDELDTDDEDDDETSTEALRYMKEFSPVLRDTELDAIIAFEQSDTIGDPPAVSSTRPSSPFIDEDFAAEYAEDAFETSVEGYPDQSPAAPCPPSYALDTPRLISVAEDDPIEVATASDVLHGMLGLRWLGPDHPPIRVLGQQQNRAAGKKNFLADLDLVWKILGYGGTFPGDRTGSLGDKSRYYGLNEIMGGELLTFISDLEFFGWDLKQAKSKKGNSKEHAVVEQEALTRARTAMPSPETYIHHPLAWDRTWNTMHEGGLRYWTVSRAMVLLPSDDLVSPPRETQAYAIHRRTDEGRQCSVPPLILFDAMIIWHILHDSNRTFHTYRKIIQYCADTGVRFCLPSREESRPLEVTAEVAAAYKDDVVIPVT